MPAYLFQWANGPENGWFFLQPNNGTLRNQTLMLKATRGQSCPMVTRLHAAMGAGKCEAGMCWVPGAENKTTQL